MPLFRTPATGPHSTVLARSPLRPEQLMPLMADHPLPEMFTGWGPFPAVSRTTGQEGSWDRVGKSRTIHLADGGRVTETIVEYRPGQGFAYELTRFTDVFDRLVHGVRGEWGFAPDGGGTIVRWTWEFAARRGRRRLMALVVGPLWGVYMRRMIRDAVRDLSRRGATIGV